MTTVLSELKRLGDILKYEVNPALCRSAKPIATAQSLSPGDVCEFSGTEKVKLTAAVNEVQSIVFGGAPTGGTFVLWVQNTDGVMVPTTALAHSASAATISTALDVATGVATGIVATGTTLPDQTITFTYSGTGFAGLGYPMIVSDISLLTGGAPTAVESRTTAGHSSGGLADSVCLETITAVDEVQTVVMAGTPTGGTFTLTFLHYTGVEVTTGTIAYNAADSVVLAAINAVLGVSAVAVSLIATPLPDDTITITFSGANYAGEPQRIVSADIALLTGGPPTAVEARTTVGKGANGLFLIRGPAIVDYNQLDFNARTEANALAALAALDIQTMTEPTYTKQTT